MARTIPALSPAPVARVAPIAVTAFDVVSAAGIGTAALMDTLRARRSALTANDVTAAPLPGWIGRVDAVDTHPLPAVWTAWEARATRLAWLGLQTDGIAGALRAACHRHGPERIGLVLGSSAATIANTEQAYRALDADGGFAARWRSDTLNTPHAVTAFVQHALDLRGPCATVSTACSSSAKVFAQAERWLRLGVVDAVLVGGVDALSDSLLFGFHALRLLSPEPCRPFGVGRQGISIGEAAGFALLERGAAPLQLLGHGESNDAHHMSSPHPQGLGAERALDAALARAGLHAAQVDHVNLHGTGTALNDAVEAALVARRYADDVHLSATKAAIGHTMGAAGIVEAIVCLAALRANEHPHSPGVTAIDPTLPLGFGAGFARRTTRNLRIAASHSFGFGGNNGVLIFGRSDAVADSVGGRVP